jgi:hypothetical protein
MQKFFLFAMLILFFISCKEDEKTNPVATDIQRIFTLHFNAGWSNRIMNVDVDFMTNDLSEIPTVTINGQNITGFEIVQGCIQGELRNIDYSDTYNFSISANGKETAGEFIMPSAPDSVYCNGIPLTDNGVNIIPSSDSYEFSYTSSSYDYFICEFEIEDDNETLEKVSRNTTIIFEPDGGDHPEYEFRIKSLAGPILNSGDVPNVSGDYGDGYVTAESVRNEYPMTISSN